MEELELKKKRMLSLNRIAQHIKDVKFELLFTSCFDGESIDVRVILNAMDLAEEKLIDLASAEL